LFASSFADYADRCKNVWKHNKIEVEDGELSLSTLLAACFRFIWQYMVTLSETVLALRSRTDAPEITGRSCAGRKEEAFF
jgi:hypothetical protein